MPFCNGTPSPKRKPPYKVTKSLGRAHVAEKKVKGKLDGRRKADYEFCMAQGEKPLERAALMAAKDRQKTSSASKGVTNPPVQNQATQPNPTSLLDPTSRPLHKIDGLTFFSFELR
ncbi:hypothetical protein MCOR21_001195 [Pyricularia oryzae]|nr:hypothetical protein MCOR19_003343 [Pyricularia oryzae]KAI6436281.1 hypothetical protein MCOR21_001195 [Pyricularia oryzae]KAI6605406.1 hypothetical protein MCOR12_001763 [Pyricularia oryzae]